MHIKLIPPCSAKSGDDFKDVLSLPGAGRLFQQALLDCPHYGQLKSADLFVPADWLDDLDKGTAGHQGFGPEGLPSQALNGAVNEGLLISNTRLMCRCDENKLRALLDTSGLAAAAVQIRPELAAPNDLVRRTSQNHIVGFRRIFEDMVEPAATLNDPFPAFVYLSPSVVQLLAQQGPIPLDLQTLEQRLAEKGGSIRHYYLGGDCLDLDTVEGLLCLSGQLAADQLHRVGDTATIAPTARLIGPVWIGDAVRVDPDALVIGPAILCDGLHIGQGAVVRNTVLGPNQSVKAGESIHNTLCLSSDTRKQAGAGVVFSANGCGRAEPFRDWPLLSYARFGKRVFDILFSLFILLLISPVLLIVTVMVKLTSRGPVFYRARRQGRHGKDFDCLKFRTMMLQADALQERLRVVNQVDGPQFKIDNDPRITGVGKFLRDTCIDELPQFLNVLAGQMSVVGPRPSPESENDSCPAWRDARLSVRPGITGLWQVCRTRQEGQDFQEWVHYDTQYVRNLSFKQDLYICLKTAAKLINNFLDQFG